MSEQTAIVRDTQIQAVSELVAAQVLSTKRGEQVIIDFFTYMAMTGRVFNVRAGTVTTPLVGDAVIVDTAAEMCADAQSGFTIIPVYLNIGIRLGTGTLHEYAAKSVAAVSTVGDAFIPLPLRMAASGQVSAFTTARVDAEGGVTVAAEVTTTTRRHWNYANPLAIVTAGGGTQGPLEWNPRAAPVLIGPACFYVQIAATGTGPSYYANFDYVELPSAND